MNNEVEQPIGILAEENGNEENGDGFLSRLFDWTVRSIEFLIDNQELAEKFWEASTAITYTGGEAREDLLANLTNTRRQIIERIELEQIPFVALTDFFKENIIGEEFEQRTVSIGSAQGNNVISIDFLSIQYNQDFTISYDYFAKGSVRIADAVGFQVIAFNELGNLVEITPQIVHSGSTSGFGKDRRGTNIKLRITNAQAGAYYIIALTTSHSASAGNSFINVFATLERIAGYTSTGREALGITRPEPGVRIETQGFNALFGIGGIIALPSILNMIRRNNQGR